MPATATAQINKGVKSVTVELVVIRKNGTVEPLGIVSRWHKNPIKRAWLRLVLRLSNMVKTARA